MARKPKEKEEAPALTPEAILGAELTDKNKGKFHLYGIDEVFYKISTGSLVWDVYTDGGVTPGLHRLIGPPESGKSSGALEICRNFLKELPNGRGLYVKSEGRLSRAMMKRSGLKFVDKYEDWKDGTIFVLDSNVYEFIINLMRKLVKNPENKSLFCFIIDSIDGLQPAGDIDKEMDQNVKVAGTPALTKRFMQSIANEMAKRGHMLLMISQYSTNIQLDAYAAPTDKRPKQGGGGWAAAHYANFAFEFCDANNSDLIKDDPKAPAGPQNPIHGKRVKVKFKKSTNEKTGMEITYPVKYGVVGGSSVWTAIEVIDVMKMLSMIKTGTWIDFPVSLRTEIIDAIKSKVIPSHIDVDVLEDEEATPEQKAAVDEEIDDYIPEKFNGEKKMIAWFEENSNVTTYLFNQFKKMLTEEAAEAQETEAEKESTDETQESRLD